MDAPKRQSETFRANWTFIALLILAVAVCLATAFGMFVFTCTIAFPLKGYNMARSLHVFGLISRLRLVDQQFFEHANYCKIRKDEADRIRCPEMSRFVPK